jgi:hypothetical protein
MTDRPESAEPNSERQKQKPDAQTDPDMTGEKAGATPGGLDQEAVEDRGNVGQVRPEDYPADQRAKGA